MRAFARQIFNVALFTMNVSILAAAEAPPGTPSLDDQIHALQQLVIKDEGPTPVDTMPAASRHVNSLRGNVEGKDFRNALTQAKLIAGADPSPEVQKAVEALIPALQAAEDAQTAEVKGKLKVILDQATQAVLTLKDSKDFDAVIGIVATAMDQARAGAYGNGWDRQLAFTQLGGASRFLKEWQSYLIDQSAGNTQAAANDLRSLAAGNDSFMPIGRSELLERAQKEPVQAPKAMEPNAVPPKVTEAKIELHSLDDLSGAISQIESMQRGRNFNMDMNGLLNAMRNLQNAYLAYQDKNYTAALQQLVNNPFFAFGPIGPNVVGGGNGDGQESLHKTLADLKNTLLIKVVQALLALPDAAAPQKDESATDYLSRVAAAKEKAADWSGLQQVLQVYQQAAPFNSAPWLQEDLAGLHAYFVGNKLEAAGQHLDAIRSYRQSLATLGKFFPADPSAKQLDELQNKYPDLYTQALQQPITPHAP
jgi:tetratricopeptide (TPR) repeat protein